MSTGGFILNDVTGGEHNSPVVHLLSFYNST
jgi:hypothetical protein